MMQYTCLTYNAHLFGRTAEFFVNGSRRETGFYFHDADRLPCILDSARRIGADGVGFTEIWCEDDVQRIRKELFDIYPYAAVSPAAPGIGRLLEKTYEEWPRIARGIDGAVSLFTQRHYSAAKSGLVTGPNVYISEDQIARTISSLLVSGPVWGAGLLFLSRHPILTSFFLPHGRRADWEHMADKGVLWSLVQLPGGPRIRVSLGHYQEGDSPEARSARRDQIRRTRQAADFLKEGPLLCMGDFNVVGGTLEHAWMLSALELFDPGLLETYRDPNPYQKKLKAPEPSSPEARRLDYILHGEDWIPLESSVPREEFKVPGHGIYSSDHDPVYTRLGLS